MPHPLFAALRHPFLSSQNGEGAGLRSKPLIAIVFAIIITIILARMSQRLERGSVCFTILRRLRPIPAVRREAVQGGACHIRGSRLDNMPPACNLVIVFAIITTIILARMSQRLARGSVRATSAVRGGATCQLLPTSSVLKLYDEACRTWRVSPAAGGMLFMAARSQSQTVIP